MADVKMTPARAVILETLAAEIEAVKASRPRLEELIGRYVTEQGLKLSFSGGTNVARMRGVSASATEGNAAALTAWARAARRALLQGGAL